MSSGLYLCVRGSDVHVEMVDDTVITAGSAPDCDIVLADDAVAGRHCRFQAHGSELRVRDLDLDGSGYPDGLCGADIPLLPRLLGIADFYDAVTSARSYRGAMAAQAAVDLIAAASGSHFEPSLATLVAQLHERGDLLPEGWE